MNSWVMILLNAVVIPILDQVATTLEAAAKKTPDVYDDILAGAFRAVVEALKTAKIQDILKK